MVKEGLGVNCVNRNTCTKILPDFEHMHTQSVSFYKNFLVDVTDGEG